MTADLFSPIEKIHNISLSGGHGSAVSALVAHHYGIPFRLIFADTLIEDGDLYRFNRDIAEAVGQEIITLVDGRTPWDVFKDKKLVGGSRIAPCSRILKTEQVKKWLKANAEPDEPLVLGMDWSEMDRLERASKVWSPRPVVSLLNRFKVKRGDYKQWLQRYCVESPRLYKYGYPHNNCGGMCVRAGQAQFATLLLTNPKRYAWHEKEQERVMPYCTPKSQKFISYTRNGVRQFLSMREFRELHEQGKINVDPYDFGGCGCFVDDE